jgi:acetyl esterase/lipase
MKPFQGGHPPKGLQGPFGPSGPPPMSIPDMDFPLTKAEPQYRDLVYATASGAQKLDLYLPKGNGPFPVILIVHGGAFQFGDKADQMSKPGTDHLLAHGFAVANVNYRLTGEAKAPAQIKDVKTAVRWLRAHAETYHLDPSHIGAWGSSAGANLVALLGTAIGIPDLEGAELGNPNQSSLVQAVVDWFGPTDFLLMDRQLVELGFPPLHDAPDSPESLLIGAPIQSRPDLARVMNPIAYVNPNASPFLIVHGTQDNTVPYLQSKILSDALASVAGAERVTFIPLEGAAHGGGRQFWTEANIDRMMTFLDKYLK